MARCEASSLLCNLATYGPETVASFLDQIGRNNASHIGSGYSEEMERARASSTNAAGTWSPGDISMQHRLSPHGQAPLLESRTRRVSGEMEQLRRHCSIENSSGRPEPSGLEAGRRAPSGLAMPHTQQLHICF